MPYSNHKRNLPSSPRSPSSSLSINLRPLQQIVARSDATRNRKASDAGLLWSALERAQARRPEHGATTSNALANSYLYSFARLPENAPVALGVDPSRPLCPIDRARVFGR